MVDETNIPEIDVQLSFTSGPDTKKGALLLASKIKRKKGRSPSKSPNVSHKGSAHAGKNKKRKKNRKKKPRVDVLTVTSNPDEVLEDPANFDQQYNQLKTKVLSKLKGTVEITQCTKGETLEHKIEQILQSSGVNTFYLVDLSTIIVKYKNWVNLLPRIKPFYALKCNPDPRIINTLVACGAGLDVASMPEMEKGLAAGLEPESMIFANPCKMPEHVRFAKESGVKKMTFDNGDELRKIASIFPEAELVLRILADDSHSTMRFGTKFGANVSSEVEPLLELAYSLGLNVIGVSFHVGSGCQSGEAYRNSLLLAKRVFDLAESKGHPMKFLDIGGGFLGTDTETVIFADIASSIAASLEELFPDPSIKVIAEPGRYFASECMVLVTTVIARRERSHPSEVEGEPPETCVDYYISDGVYGSFNNLFFDYAQPSPVPLNKKNQEDVSSPAPEQLHHRSTLFGPTCDSIDVVCKDIDLPHLEIGDNVYFFNMGAYTAAAASSFNGFIPPTPHYIIS